MLDLAIPLSSTPIDDQELRLITIAIQRHIAEDCGTTKNLALLIGRMVLRIHELNAQVNSKKVPN